MPGMSLTVRRQNDNGTTTDMRIESSDMGCFCVHGHTGHWHTCRDLTAAIAAMRAQIEAPS